MQARVDTHIRLDATAMTGAQIDEIVRSLTFPNPDKEDAKREHVWGWQYMPDEIELFSSDGEGRLVLPRGYGRKLTAVTEWDDARTTNHLPESAAWPATQPKGPHQAEAIEKIVAAQQGVLKMPTGSGKTVAVLEAIRITGQKALVIVDKTHIMQQWADRCMQFLGFEPGYYGEGKSSDGPIIIAMQQTLWARREIIPIPWFEQFGFVCLDECHHATASTYYETLQRFPARYRIGVSATPHKNRKLSPYIDAVLGEVILDGEGDDILDPTVRVHDTAFHYLFWPTHTRSKESGKCGFGYCTRPGDGVHRNNYSEMMKSLVGDWHRNAQIAINVLRDLQDGRTVLVVSKQLRHLDAIAGIVSNRIPKDSVLLSLTGREDGHARGDVYLRAEHGNCAIFSTVADEAVDIPRLDSIHLVFPTRNTDLVKQQVGRVLRPHPDKAHPVVHDYRDKGVQILRSQFNDRKEMYGRQGWHVVGG